MKDLDLAGTKVTGKASSEWWSYLFIKFWRHAFPYSSLYIFSSYTSPSAGEVDKIVLPKGMQSVNFYDCRGLTGTAGG
jgi:hypothetical protein